MTDTDLEDRLTGMLERRASSISTTRPIRFDQSGKGRTQLAPFAVAAAAAAILVAVGGTVVGIRTAHYGARPLGTNPATSPVPTATSTGTCVRGMPRSWQPAIAAGQLALDHPINNVISVNAGTGDYLVDQVQPAAAGKSGQVTLAVFNGKTGQDVAQLPGNGSSQALADGSAAITADWITYELYQPGGENGYRTALLYNRHTRQSIVLDDPTSTTGQLSGGPILFDGKVYWLEAFGAEHRGVVKSYDLASAARTETPVIDAADLLYYGSGLAVITRSDQGSALVNYTGQPLAPSAIRAAVEAGQFTYDGTTLRWWNFTINPFLPVLYANRPGSGQVSRQTVDGQNLSGVNTWPFAEVQLPHEFQPIVDLRTNALLGVPYGLNVQAVFGDRVLIGSGLSTLGNGGLSLVSLKELPPAYC